MTETVDTAAKRLELLRYIAHGVEGAADHMRSARWPWNGVYLELAKLELERLGEDAPPLEEDRFARALDHARARLDCCDFSMAALLRIVYRYPDSALLTPALREAIAEVCLAHIYWVDEPGEEHMCFCTENHQIIHHANELLAGQLWPDEVFTNNGQTGRWRQEHALTLIRRWLDWRARFGFSEWNSNCYYDEDLMALPNLADYAQDQEVVRRSRGVIDLILFHMAVNSYRGTFGSTHGRTYARHILSPRRENTSPLAYLFWGQGSMRETLSASAVQIASSEYRLPPVIQRVALDAPAEMEARERHSLSVEDSRAHGLEPSSLDDIGFYWGAQVFGHRQVVETSLRLAPEKHNLYPRLKAYYDHQMEAERLGEPYDPDPDNTAMSQVDIYTFRTPEYMLSCAQDYRKGKHGFQQHIWQATLADDAVVFTTHPGARDVGTSRPDYWHSNGFLPRAAAYRNVVVCLYRFNPALLHMWFTHAYFPRHVMDEWTERGGWVFGRKGDGYVALRSLNKAEWAPPREDVNALIRPAGAAEDWAPELPYEIVALGPKNAWVCELGSPATHGSFERFVAEIAAARVEGDPLGLEYASPSVGRVEFGWEGDLRVDGRAIPLHDYPRFDNPYCQAPFDSRRYEIRHGQESLTLEF